MRGLFSVRARHAGAARRGRSMLAISMAMWCLLLVAPPALGNMAAPWTPGTTVGEPSGSLANIAIEHETLTFDLRPLATSDLGEVTATYRLRNDGGPADVELLFVSPRMQEARVTLDGAPVGTVAAPDAPLPPSWKSPTSVPSIDGGTETFESAGGTAAYRFQVTIPGGTHELVMRYRIVPGEYHPGSPYHDFQVAYVLAPARSWASFGTLDVSVDLPAGWEAVASLPVQRAGDRLTGTFSGIPADTLGITTRPLVPPGDPLGSVVLLSILIATPLLAFLLARSIARRYGLLPRLAVIAVAPVVSLVALAILLPLTDAMTHGPLEERFVSRTWSYARMYAAIGLPLIGGVLGLTLGLTGAAAGVIVGSARRRGPAPPLPPWMTRPPAS